MHEMGTIMYVIKTVNAVCEQNDLKQVQSVTLQIGEVSGIIPGYLTDFWKWAVSKESRMSNAELIIETIAAKTRCGDCNCLYSTIRYAKVCPECGSENTWLETGNEYMIKEICAS